MRVMRKSQTIKFIIRRSQLTDGCCALLRHKLWPRCEVGLGQNEVTVSRIGVGMKEVYAPNPHTAHFCLRVYQVPAQVPAASPSPRVGS